MMHDSYPGFFSYILWTAAGLLLSFGVLILTPVGKDVEKRGDAFTAALVFAGLLVGAGFMFQRSHSADAVREANRKVAEATMALEDAVRAEQQLAIMGSPGDRPVSTNQDMSFSACKDRIQQMAITSGAGETIVDAADAKIVRFHATDGSVLVTCSKPDRKMVITRSSRR